MVNVEIDEIEISFLIKEKLSQELRNFKPGSLLTIHPECYTEDEYEFKSVFLYLDIEDVNDVMGMESPTWLSTWLNNKEVEFNKKIFLYLGEDVIALQRGGRIEKIPVAQVLDCDRVINIPLYMLIEADSVTF